MSNFRQRLLEHKTSVGLLPSIQSPLDRLPRSNRFRNSHQTLHLPELQNRQFKTHSKYEEVTVRSRFKRNVDIDDFFKIDPLDLIGLDKPSPRKIRRPKRKDPRQLQSFTDWVEYRLGAKHY